VPDRERSPAGGPPTSRPSAPPQPEVCWCENPFSYPAPRDSHPASAQHVDTAMLTTATLLVTRSSYQAAKEVGWQAEIGPRTVKIGLTM